MYFVIGLAIYGARLVTSNSRRKIQISAYLGAGSVAGSIIGWIAGYPLYPLVDMPPLLLSVPGLCAGGLCFIAESKGLLDQPGFKYVVTIFLGGVTAACIWVVTVMYMQIFDPAVHMVLSGSQQAIIYISAGFMLIFGYTFPARWFKQRRISVSD